MAITLRYNPAYSNVMGVAQDTGEGDLLRQLNEIARRDQMEAARLDEQARQFDLGLAANQQNQASQRGYQYAALGANVAKNQASMQQRAFEQQSMLDARLAEQQMQGDQMLAGQQMQNQRAFVGEQARMAREAANRRFEKSMKDREVLLDQFQRGMLTPQQEQQAIASWEESAQMDWGMPDEMAAQDEGQAMQERVAAIESTFFSHPITKEPLVSEGAVAKMLEMGMDIKDITSQGLKLQSEARQTEAMKMAEGQEKLKQEKVFSDMEADNQRAAQSLQHQQNAHEQKLVMDANKAVQQSQIARAQALGQAMTADSKSAVPKELKLEDLLPANLLPNSGPPEWYLKLKPGEEYTAPDGSRRIKGK